MLYQKTHKKLSRYCAPINLGNSHWIVMDVVMPHAEYQNGLVQSIDHLGALYNSMKSYSLEKWWAKLLGMYYQYSLNPNKEIHCGYDDVTLAEYKQEDTKHSSLNHCVMQNGNMVIQDDTYNCGVWVIAEFVHRLQEDYPKSINTAAGYKDDFVGCTKIRLSIFDLIMRIY